MGAVFGVLAGKKPSCLTARRVGVRGRGGLDPVGKL